MPSNDAQDMRFIKVSQITITDPTPKRWGGDYRVVIKHDYGTKQTISSSGSGKEVTIECKTTFVQLNAGTTIQIHRAKEIDRDSDPSGPLNIPTADRNDYTVSLSGKPGMIVKLKLGEEMTATQVAEARVRDANEVLEKESKNAEDLERVMGHVKILVDVAALAAKFDPFPHAEAAVSIAKMALEGMKKVPTEYKELKDVALKCVKHIEFNEDAREVYTTPRVRKQLNSAMALVIEALEFIFHYYSHSRIARIRKSLGSTIKGLTTKLEEQKEQIILLFLVDIHEAQGKGKGADEERPLERDGNTQRIPKRSQGKECWVFANDANEADLLKRFLGKIGGVSEGKEPCLPGTRVSILEQLSSWAPDDSPKASRLFWLYGIAGCGKSAVAVSTSRTLNKAESFVGSFFCRRDEVGRRNPVQLFARLATCLADKNPVFKEALIKSLTAYRRLDNNDPSTFIEYALTEPLKAENCAPSTPLIFLVDALDECDDSGTVARFLAEIVAETPWIKLIVTSRETPEIKTAFVDSSIARVEHDLFTDNAQSDVHEYLLKRLNRDLHHYVPAVAEKSGGLFIWLHTVTEVVITAKWGREKKLQAFLEQPLSEDSDGRMAATYLTVLEQASGSSETGKAIVRMIAGLLVITSTNTPLTIDGLYTFLPPTLAKELSLNEFSDIVMALKPVLKLTSESGGPSEETTALRYRLVVQVHHASFLDFCERKDIPCRTVDGVEATATLSNPFWTDPITLHRNMAMGCLEIMKQGRRLVEPNEPSLGLRFNVCELETSHKLNSEIDDLQERIATHISPHLLYSSLYWASHVLKSSLDESAPAEKTNIQDALGDFLSTTRSLFWLEVLSLTGNLTAGIEALVNIAMQTETKLLERFAQTVSEMSRFAEQCFPAISASTPHLYLSLAWLPVESLLWSAWKTEFPNTSILKDPIRQLSPSQLISSTQFPVRVDTFAVSPDKKQIVSGSGDGYIRLWDIRSSIKRVKARHLSPDSAPIDALAYTPDGSHILCACGGFIYVYELSADILLTIEERREILQKNVRCMAVSQEHIALGTKDGKVVILDAKTYREVSSEQPYEQTGAVDAIAISPDGSRLVYSSFTGDVRICDVPVANGSYRHIGRPIENSPFVMAVAFSLDGKNIVTGSWRGKVRLWDVESGEEIGGFNVRTPVQFLTFSYGNRIICALESDYHSRDPGDSPQSSNARRLYILHGCHLWGEETTLQIWDVDFTSRQQIQSAGHTSEVTSVAFSPDGKQIVSGSDDRSVRVWDAQTGEPKELAEMKHLDLVRFVTFSPDGKFVASGGDDKVIRIWDVQTGNPVRVLEGHTDLVHCGAYSPDATRVVSGSIDGTLRIWNMEPKKRLGIIPRAFKRPTSEHEDSVMSGHEDSITSVAFSPDSSCIASGSDDSTIRLWDGKTGKPSGDPLRGHEYCVHSVAFSPEGARLVSGGSDGTILIWDVKTRSVVGEPLLEHIDAVSSVAFSPDGAFIFSASWDGAIRCWDAVTGSPVGHPLKGHSSYIFSLAVSPDGIHNNIVSGSWDGCIQFWNSRSFEWEVDELFVGCGPRGPNRILDKIPEDGWIRLLDDEYLLWVPDQHRKVVCGLYVLSISKDEKNKPNRIMWERIRHGRKWTDIRERN